MTTSKTFEQAKQDFEAGIEQPAFKVGQYWWYEYKGAKTKRHLIKNTELKGRYMHFIYINETNDEDWYYDIDVTNWFTMYYAGE